MWYLMNQHDADADADAGAARNTVAPLIQQELLYVGDEYGKLIALRDIIRKVLHINYF